MQRYALTLLFALLGGGLAAVAIWALAGAPDTRRIVVGVAAASVALWLWRLSFTALRRGR